MLRRVALVSCLLGGLACASPSVAPLSAGPITPGPGERVAVTHSYLVVDSSESVQPEFASDKALVQSFVRGLQGDHPRYWQAASLMKHFLANSNENERGRSSSSFDERLFREYYSVPFRKGVEAGSRAFMAAYNAYNGVPCHVHPMLEGIDRKSTRLNSSH